MSRPFAEELFRVAKAWDGDARALGELARTDESGELADRHRAGPALCHRALVAGIEPPDAWKTRRLATAGRQMLLEDALRGVGHALAEASIPWAPIKGLDLITRPGVYENPESRPTSDVDLLLAEDRLEDARRALAAFGARDLVSGPKGERYLREEGYAWQASLPSKVLVEIHFRLWAQVHPDLAAEILAAAAIPEAEIPEAAIPEAEIPEAAPETGSRLTRVSRPSPPSPPSPPSLPGARRLRTAHAYLLAALHAFTVPPPRGAGIWRDLAALADADPGLAERVIEDAERFDLQLPVALAAGLSARLWNRPPCREVSARLLPSLRLAERRVRNATDAQNATGAATLPLAQLALARHLARRRCRHGLLHAAWRRLWPHPGVVEAATEEGWWPLRRLGYLQRTFPFR